MASVTYFPPNTDAQVRLTVVDRDGVAITSGTATAEIYSPSGQHVGTGVVLTYSGSGGIWLLPVSATWSFISGAYIQGEYVAMITMSYSGNTLTKRVRWPVLFDDTE